MSKMTAFARSVLLAVKAESPDATGTTVRDRLAERTGRAPPMGTIHATFERLEILGYVTSRKGMPDPRRKGTAPLVLAVTENGLRALESTGDPDLPMSHASGPGLVRDRRGFPFAS